jgi:opacity protein-like surface antigen
MKKNTLIVVLVLLLLFTFACRTLQGGGSSDVTGTTWTMTYYDKAVQQEYTYDITFLAGGKLSNSHPNDTTPDNDSWEQNGTTVTLYFNNSYATYTGTIEGNSISGTASNVAGSTWEWSAVRK